MICYRSMKLLALCLLSTLAVFADARVRVVHASPDAPKVDILVLGQVAIEALPYGEYTDYIPLPVPSGTYPVQINVSGTSTMVTTLNVTIENNRSYTVVALGFAAAGKSPGFRVIVLPDDRDAPPAGAAYVRAIHAAPSVPAVDIYALPYAYITARASDPAIKALPFGAATGYERVPAGQYFVRLTPAGQKTIAADAGRLMLDSRAVKTVIALDTGFLVLQD